jgi:hypothetical protein
MPSSAIRETSLATDRARNAELDAPFGRCRTCHAPLPDPRPDPRYFSRRPGRPREFCRPACKLYAWRRGGDPDAELDYRRRR